MDKKFNTYDRVIVTSCYDKDFSRQHGVIANYHIDGDTSWKYHVKFDNPTLGSAWFREDQLRNEREVGFSSEKERDFERVLKYIARIIKSCCDENHILYSEDYIVRSIKVLVNPYDNEGNYCSNDYFELMSSAMYYGRPLFSEKDYKFLDLPENRNRIIPNINKMEINWGIRSIKIWIGVKLTYIPDDMSSPYFNVMGIFPANGYYTEFWKEYFKNHIVKPIMDFVEQHPSRITSNDIIMEEVELGCVNRNLTKVSNDCFRRMMKKEVKMNVIGYIKSDMECTREVVAYNYSFLSSMRNFMQVEKAIFNPPYTIVIFKDKTKVIVKAGEGEEYDPEKGFAMALCKKMLGSNKSGSNYYDIFKKFLPKENDSESHKRAMEHKEGNIVTCKVAVPEGEDREEFKKKMKTVLETFLLTKIDDKLADAILYGDGRVEKKEDLNPCENCPDKKTGCFANCEKLQDLSDRLNEGYKQTSKLRVKSSDDIKNERTERIDGQKGFIKDVYTGKYKPVLSPVDFIKFCKDNSLYFCLDDEIDTEVDPCNITWQQVNGYLRKGKLAGIKVVKKLSYKGKYGDHECLMVDLNYVIFVKGNRKENS